MIPGLGRHEYDDRAQNTASIMKIALTAVLESLPLPVTNSPVSTISTGPVALTPGEEEEKQVDRSCILA